MLAVGGCATGFDKSNTNAIKRIAVIAPENPPGHVPVVVPPSGPTAVYVPSGGGLIGAVVVGVAVGLIQGAQKNAANQQAADTDAALRQDYATFLANGNVALGDELADDTRNALRRDGYDVVDGGKSADAQGADAILTFEIIDLGIGAGFGSDLISPQLKVRATLRKASAKTIIYEKTYHYAGQVHSMWDEPIQADSKYTVFWQEIRADHDKLLIEGIRAGALEISNHIGTAMNSTQITASAAR